MAVFDIKSANRTIEAIEASGVANIDFIFQITKLEHL